MEILSVIFIILLVIIIWYVTTYNRFVTVSNKIDEALSGIDVALARRYSTLINVVEVVKGYAKHEQEVFTKIIELRNHTMSEREQVLQNQDEAITKLFALQENYPELKANGQFIELQKTIVDLEEHLAASRRMYNSNVSIYNDLVLTFPSNLVGNMMHATKKEYFQASIDEKQNVNIQL